MYVHHTWKNTKTKKSCNAHTARSRQDETRNGHRNTNWNPEWSSWVSSQTAHSKKNMNFNHPGFRFEFRCPFGSRLFGDRLYHAIYILFVCICTYVYTPHKKGPTLRNRIARWDIYIVYIYICITCTYTRANVHMYIHYMCDMTRSCVWRDSFLWVTWRLTCEHEVSHAHTITQTHIHAHTHTIVMTLQWIHRHLQHKHIYSLRCIHIYYVLYIYIRNCLLISGPYQSSWTDFL